MYSLIPKFEDGKNEYPFELAKSNIASYQPDYRNHYSEQIQIYELEIQKEIVCLDNDLLSNLYFWNHQWKDKCNYFHDFEIMKLINWRTWESKKFDVDKILSITFALSNKQQYTVVQSYKFMELMGDLGGIKEVLFICLAYFGMKASATLMASSVAQDNYM